MPLVQSFYARDTVEVAKDLLGAILVRSWEDRVVEGIIVETEAYCFKDDPASHAYQGKTKRTEVMFGPVGHVYVYFIYGNWYCLNVTARTNNQEAGAVLIRALNPLRGLEYMHKARKTTDIYQLTNGPGKLAQALHITKQDNGIDMTKKGSLYIRKGSECNRVIQVSSRIGITRACEKPWRFYIQDSLWVSRSY